MDQETQKAIIDSELLSKYGWDDGGPISQHVQSRLKLRLEASLPLGWKLGWIVDEALHNPHPSAFCSPDGSWIEVREYHDIPEPIRNLFEEFVEDIPDILKRFVRAAEQAVELLRLFE